MMYLDGSDMNLGNIPSLPFVNANLNDFYCIRAEKSTFSGISIQLEDSHELSKHVCQFDCNQGNYNYIS